jgi:hypothetical protein
LLIKMGSKEPRFNYQIGVFHKPNGRIKTGS